MTPAGLRPQPQHPCHRAAAAELVAGPGRRAPDPADQGQPLGQGHHADQIEIDAVDLELAIQHLPGVQARATRHGASDLRAHRVSCFRQVANACTSLPANPVGERQQA